MLWRAFSEVGVVRPPGARESTTSKQGTYSKKRSKEGTNSFSSSLLELTTQQIMNLGIRVTIPAIARGHHSSEQLTGGISKASVWNTSSTQIKYEKDTTKLDWWETTQWRRCWAGRRYVGLGEMMSVKFERLLDERRKRWTDLFEGGVVI